MRSVHFIAVCCFTGFFYVLSERVPENHEEGITGPTASETEENMSARDHHTFVALIDIVFTDTSKRTCTGTIIHDYVVITAGHCFIKETTSPELTLSFIVIGTRKMFDSGYEQYLPIERYKIHPQFRGWTADLALVYTFAAMTSDKPGKVLPLASDVNKNPMDSTLTVLSWGQCPEKFKFGPMKIYSKKVHEKINKFDDTGEDVTKCSKIKPDPQDDEDENPHHPTYMRVAVTPETPTENSRYLPDNNVKVKTKSHKNKRRYQEISLRRLPDPVKAHYSNWRRGMGPQQNNLTVETFSITTLQSCKKLIEIAMPPLYDIKEGNEVVCYSSEDYVITTEDAGAPAVRHGRLFAVTVGGINADGEQVAVGVRLSCFCSWIAANMPSGGNTMNCCKKCCESERGQKSRSRTGEKKPVYT